MNTFSWARAWRHAGIGDGLIGVSVTIAASPLSAKTSRSTSARSM
jgi:hypothetical protein